MTRRATPVICIPAGAVVRVRPGEDLLAAARRAGVPLAASCGGRAVCGDCVVRVLAGAENLEPAPQGEVAWRARTGKGGDALRLACCLRVRGPVEVSTTYW